MVEVYDNEGVGVLELTKTFTVEYAITSYL